MRIRFLGHSGFLVELPRLAVLFDWYTGELPNWGDKPLAVFVSHRHGDHYQPQIFDLGRKRADVFYFLSRDIRLGPKRQAALGLGEELMSRVRFLRPGEHLALPDQALEIDTLPSTDEGVAFLLRCGGTVLYHAGDLHWWHWEGEDKAWNRNMEVNFKRYTAPLEGRHIDLAMLPLDPRLEEAWDWGATWLLERADITRWIPMHLWEDFSLPDRFASAHPTLADKTVRVEGPGQCWEFPDP